MKYLEQLQNIRNLPSIPAVIFEVSRMLDNPMTSASELAKIISRDQGMVAKILTMANSPLYGLPRRVSTIEFAIVILGFENIKNIVIALSMIEAMKTKEDKQWNRKSYWYHSLAVASIAKRIADDLAYSKSGEAFIAGLLHDLGISIIQAFLNDEFKSIINLSTERQITYFNAEVEVLSATHQEVGHYLSEKWNLPKPLGNTIMFHHNPSLAQENHDLISIVHFADYLSNRINFGNFDWDKGFELDPSIIEVLRLGNESYLDEVVKNYSRIFNQNIETILS